jgi:thiol:disulfide interchange protein DsbD
LLVGLAGHASAQLLPGLGRTDELLDPEKAFRISARALDRRSVEVEFRIAEGYYLYRDRFSFATASGRPLADVEIPRGTPKEDPFFGRTQTFRKGVRIRVPVSAQEAAKGSVDLKVTSQGCADVGVCYLPLEQTVRVELPGRAAALPRQSR